MADTDASSPILRYNLISGVVEYFNGADYYPVATAPDAGITQLTGGVTAGPGNGSQVATVVSVGGSTAAAVHTSVLATLAATASPTPNTLVLRDGAASTQFRDLAIMNTQSGGDALIDLRATDTNQLNAIVLHNDSDSAQAYFAMGNSTYGNVLTRNSPSIISAGLAFPLVMETQGFLPPLYTTTNRDAISSPHEGLTLYNTTTHALNFYNGSVWGGVGGGSPAGANTQIQYNGSGSFAASAQLTFVSSSNFLSLIDPSTVGSTVVLASDIAGQGPSILFTDPAHPITAQYGVLGADGDGNMDLNSNASVLVTTNTASTPQTFLFGPDGGLQLPQLSARPGSPVAGEIIYNNTSHHVEYYNGTTWVTL